MPSESCIMTGDDLKQDRRRIMRKIQQRRKNSMRGDDGGGLDVYSDQSYGFNHPHMEAHAFKYDDDSGQPLVDKENDNENGYYGGRGRSCLSLDAEEMLRNVARGWHHEWDSINGGRMTKDSRHGQHEENEEGIEAMTRALTNRPVAWWEMRRQRQRNHIQGGGLTVTNLVGGQSGPQASLDGGVVGMALSDDGNDDHDEDSDFVANGERPWSHSMNTGVVSGHPIMLEDPSRIGYNISAFQHGGSFVPPPSSSHKKNWRCHAPAVMYVSHDAVHKRRAKQGLYIIASLCFVCLFMFFLRQRKLSNYAVVESPMSLSAYLVGEELLTITNAKPERGGKC